MNDSTQPTVRDHSDQPGEALDAAKLPDEMPEQPLASRAFGITAEEHARGESNFKKLQRERREDGSLTVEPSPTDPDAPVLVDQADADGIDRQDNAVSQPGSDAGHGVSPTSGRPQAPQSAEEAAMNVVEDAPGAVDRRATRPI